MNAVCVKINILFMQQIYKIVTGTLAASCIFDHLMDL